MVDFVTVRQAADIAGVAPGTVYRWLYDDAIPLTRHKTANGRVRVERKELDAWQAARNTPVPVRDEAS
ncbi:helix-turn-helix domain-containing protein [Streptomyces sp. NPDC017936]|uniref:helix-turn-helix domain-containing protein n=1 Tax=Streptomyces sp. NPDC017936 TaxID=3365016 RepID=UPI0037BE1346